MATKTIKIAEIPVGSYDCKVVRIRFYQRDGIELPFIEIVYSVDVDGRKALFSSYKPIKLSAMEDVREKKRAREKLKKAQ